MADVDWKKVEHIAEELPQKIGERMDSEKWKNLYDSTMGLSEPTSFFVDEMLLLHKPAEIVLVS